MFRLCKNARVEAGGQPSAVLNDLTRLSPAAENVFIDHGVDVWRCESFFWFIKKTVK